jgi:hypothetical protein
MFRAWLSLLVVLSFPIFSEIGAFAMGEPDVPFGGTGKIYFLAAIDNEDKDILSIDDLRGVRRWFKDVFENPDNPRLFGRGNFYTFGEKSPLRYTQVESFLKSLKQKLGPEDVIVFYFSGHGAYEKEAGQLFSFPDDSILRPRSLIRKGLVNTKAGHVVIISDACGTAIRAKNDGFVELNKVVSPGWPVIEDLFFGHTGVTVLSAASPGEAAYPGVFTPAFIQLLSEPPSVSGIDYNRDGKITWPEFLGKARKYSNNYLNISRETAPADDPIRVASQTTMLVAPGPTSRESGTTVQPTYDPHASKINSVSLEFNATDSAGNRGLVVETNLRIRNHKGEKCSVGAYFYTADGRPILDRDGKFKDTLGHVAIGKSLTPDFAVTDYNNLRLFIPYNQLGNADLSGDGQNLYVRVMIFNSNARISLDRSEAYNFWVRK